MFPGATPGKVSRQRGRGGNPKDVSFDNPAALSVRVNFLQKQRVRNMLQFILRRLGLVIPTFIGITLLTFAFVHMILGDPVLIMAGERGMSAERHAQMMADMG